MSGLQLGQSLLGHRVDLGWATDIGANRPQLERNLGSACGDARSRVRRAVFQGGHAFCSRVCIVTSLAMSREATCNGVPRIGGIARHDYTIESSRADSAVTRTFVCITPANGVLSLIATCFKPGSIASRSACTAYAYTNPAKAVSDTRLCGAQRFIQGKTTYRGSVFTLVPQRDHGCETVGVQNEYAWYETTPRWHPDLSDQVA